MDKVNVLLHTDVYKIGHEAQYPEGTVGIYSTLVARSGKVYPASVVFGMSYYLKEYLMSPLTAADVVEFMYYADAILGQGVVKPEAFERLQKLGYWPLEVKVLPEGSLVSTGNVLATFESTHPGFSWVGGFVEGLLLKTWNTMTVATNSFRLRKVVELFAELTADNQDHVAYQIHDFGYRGCSSEETAALGGAAHLLSFNGTDTVPGVVLLDRYYNQDGSTPVTGIGNSVPASEHSIATSEGPEGEYAYMERMLDRYPTGIVSIVADSFDLWRVITEYVPRLKERILARDGKTVLRPDSGDPELILLGNPAAAAGSPENLGVLELLWNEFGGGTNAKGYRVLDAHIGVIYGDGIYFERLVRILVGMERKGFATLVPFGIGGLLLQQFSRDQLGFATKATYVETLVSQPNGPVTPIINAAGEVTGYAEEGKIVGRNIMKDPVTDHGKKSHKGRVVVERDADGRYVTRDEVSKDESDGGLLQLVFRDGKLYNQPTLAGIRARLRAEAVPAGFAPTKEELYALADSTALPASPYGFTPSARKVKEAAPAPEATSEAEDLQVVAATVPQMVKFLREFAALAQDMTVEEREKNLLVLRELGQEMVEMMSEEEELVTEKAEVTLEWTSATVQPVTSVGLVDGSVTEPTTTAPQVKPSGKFTKKVK